MSTKKAESLDQLWTEAELGTRLGLPVRKSGKCVPLSFMVRGGLVHAEKSGRRFYFESDILEYFWGRRVVPEKAE